MPPYSTHPGLISLWWANLYESVLCEMAETPNDAGYTTDDVLRWWHHMAITKPHSTITCYEHEGTLTPSPIMKSDVWCQNQ